MTLKLDTPADIRELIRGWIDDVCKNGRLPFEGGGVVVQLMQCWLRSYEVEKLETIDARLSALENARQKGD